jgi:DNA (cytosine-5)-methyltransferase 1
VNARQPYLVMTIDHQSSGAGGGLASGGEPMTTITAKARHALVAPSIVGCGGRMGQSPPRSMDRPMQTITSKADACIVAAFLAKHYTGVVGSDLRQPLGTITAKDHHSLVHAFLVAYYGNEKDGRSLHEPMGTIVSKDRFGLITVQGEPHYIADIGMRMLAPRELFKAQGFPDDVQLLGTATSQVRLCGNSVSPPLAAAIVRANVGDIANREAA